MQTVWNKIYKRGKFFSVLASYLTSTLKGPLSTTRLPYIKLFPFHDVVTTQFTRLIHFLQISVTLTEGYEIFSNYHQGLADRIVNWSLLCRKDSLLIRSGNELDLIYYGSHRGSFFFSHRNQGIPRYMYFKSTDLGTDLELALWKESVNLCRKTWNLGTEFYSCWASVAMWIKRTLCLEKSELTGLMHTLKTCWPDLIWKYAPVLISSGNTCNIFYTPAEQMLKNTQGKEIYCFSNTSIMKLAPCLPYPNNPHIICL